MQVQRIVHKKVIPLTMALMAWAGVNAGVNTGVNAAKPVMLNDSFERIEPKKEIVQPDRDNERPSSKINWISVGVILLILGVIKLGDIVEHKENKSEKENTNEDIEK